MERITQKIQDLDWTALGQAMDANGYAIIPSILTETACEDLKLDYDNPRQYRKTVIMQRYRFGLGEYKYFHYPLPGMLQSLRTQIYPYLAPIANRWFSALRMERQFPKTHEGLLGECRHNGQEKATPLILKYGAGGFNTLHQDLNGDVFFPLQLVLMLSKPDQDFTGGEFVLTQQIPRAQSKAVVVKPHKGDAVIFATSVMPQKGAKGYYRVHMKHGVSEVTKGERYSLGIIFHDATT